MTKINNVTALTTRLFLAIKINPDHKFLRETSRINEWLSNEKIRWVKPENLHITMLFLGDTDVRLIPGISQQLAPHIMKIKAFQLNLLSLGIFRNVFHPRVLWIGAEKTDELINLKKVIDSQLKFVFNLKETDHFEFHLTLGRMKAINDISHLKEIIQADQDFHFMSIKVEALSLFESILDKTGPVYKELEKYPLAV